MTDFIEVYPNALDAETCRRAIETFEASPQVQPGQVMAGVDTALKNSLDLTITGLPEWREFLQAFHRAAFIALKEYVRKHPYALIGVLALRYQERATGQIVLVNEETFPNLPDEEFTKMLIMGFRSGSINLQKYRAGQGGYPHWHSEICPRDASCETLHRHLLYTFYLNDVPEAGETEFYFQQRKIQPTAGTLLIAPAGFTHTHRGNTPIGGDKYIATSWILFSRAESLFR